MAAMNLSRRERQIMDIIYRLERASAAEVLDRLPNAPSYSAVRAMLRILEEKGHLLHTQDGPRYIYSPTVAAAEASRSALRHVLKTFFDGSPAQAMAALLDETAEEMSDDELARLSTLIEQAQQDGR